MDDCDDSSATVYPGAAEVVDNGIDEDCDGGEACYADLDDDGFREMTGALMTSADLDCVDLGEGRMIDPATDCDDNDENVNPIATEIVADGIDSNCDTTEICYVDGDNDGYRDDSGSTVSSADLDCGDAGEADADVPTGDCDDNSSSGPSGATRQSLMA